MIVNTCQELPMNRSKMASHLKRAPVRAYEYLKILGGFSGNLRYYDARKYLANKTTDVRDCSLITSAKTGVPRPPRSAIGQLMADPPSHLVTDKLSAMISCRLTPLTWDGAALKLVVSNWIYVLLLFYWAVIFNNDRLSRAMSTRPPTGPVLWIFCWILVIVTWTWPFQ